MQMQKTRLPTAPTEYGLLDKIPATIFEFNASKCIKLEDGCRNLIKSQYSLGAVAKPLFPNCICYKRAPWRRESEFQIRGVDRHF